MIIARIKEKGAAAKKPDSLIFPNGEAQNRTEDTRIFSPLLYRLSYLASMNGAECNVIG